MLTTELFYSHYQLMHYLFNLGYTVGSKSNDKHKITAPCPARPSGYFLPIIYWANRLSAAPF